MSSGLAVWLSFSVSRSLSLSLSASYLCLCLWMPIIVVCAFNSCQSCPSAQFAVHEQCHICEINRIDSCINYPIGFPNACLFPSLDIFKWSKRCCKLWCKVSTLLVVNAHHDDSSCYYLCVCVWDIWTLIRRCCARVCVCASECLFACAFGAGGYKVQCAMYSIHHR